MKLQINIIAELDIYEPIDQEAWPNCKTITDVAKYEQKLYENGDTYIENLVEIFKIKSVKFNGIN